MRKIILAAVSALAVSACSSIDCPVQNSVYTSYKLFKANGQADTLTDTLTILTKRVDGTDSVVFNRGVSLLKFDLPISYTNAEDTFIFHRKSTTAEAYDTVRIQKDNYAHFESVDCQIAYFHTITGVSTTGHFIDSITVNKSTVDYDTSTEHFHLYFKRSL